MTRTEFLKERSLDYLMEYVHFKSEKQEFVPGHTPVPVSGKVFGIKEIINGIEAVLEGWWTEGKWTRDFEYGLKRAVGARAAVMVNSGSSANLIAMATLKEHFKIKDGDPVVTTAAAFPTTVNPILQLGLRPVFVDVLLPTYVPPVEWIAHAVSKTSAKAVVLAHTLGNPWDVGGLNVESAVPVLEDNCDALGSEIWDKKTGSLGYLATQSFYPAHHITTGEGGAVLCNVKEMEKIVRSYRDWGRDCWCGTGKDNTCGKRYDWDFPNLPKGFDHKYVYSRIGWNMKSTDLNAAIGVAQLKSLNEFTKRRRVNFDFYTNAFIEERLDNFFILPKATSGSKPSWFGFPLTVRMDAGFTREELIRFLGERMIGTRMLFAGNILNHPAYDGIEHEIYGTLANTNRIMEDTFWIGVYPGLTQEMLEFTVQSFIDFVAALRSPPQL